jgi:hypothetical protein
VHCSNLLIDAAAGGCLLFSARRKGSFSARVLPAAGRPFTLSDLATGQPQAGTTAGVFQVDSAPPAATSTAPVATLGQGLALLVPRGSEWFYGGTVVPRRGSHRFPTAEVVASVKATRGVLDACVVPLARPNPRGSWSFYLLVFVDPSACSSFAARVEGILASEIGPEGIPDRTEIIPYRPRRINRELDVSWYERRYQTRVGDALGRHPTSRTLSMLRARLSASDSVQRSPSQREVGTTC